MDKPDNGLVQRYIEIRKQGQQLIDNPQRDTQDGLILWLILCLLVFACIMVNYWASIQVGVE